MKKSHGNNAKINPEKNIVPEHTNTFPVIDFEEQNNGKLKPEITDSKVKNSSNFVNENQK